MTQSEDTATQKHAREHVPLAQYRFQPQSAMMNDFQFGAIHDQKDDNYDAASLPMVMAKQVYMIKCQPQVIPLDINLPWLLEQGWNSHLDRIRYSVCGFHGVPEQLFVRRFDPSPAQDFCILIQVQPNMQLTVYGNDRELTEVYFKNIFLNNSQNMDVKWSEMQVTTSRWVDAPHELMFYCGAVHAAFGVWGRVLVEMQLNHSLNSSVSNVPHLQRSMSDLALN